MGCCVEHLDSAGEFGLGREAEKCRYVLSVRQAAAVCALKAAANQAAALAFLDALQSATDVSRQPLSLSSCPHGMALTPSYFTEIESVMLHQDAQNRGDFAACIVFAIQGRVLPCAGWC